MDMDLTARLIAGAPLIVAIDTMTAHLAGALGRPVWLLVKHHPDWRWPVDTERTPGIPRCASGARTGPATGPGRWRA